MTTEPLTPAGLIRGIRPREIVEASLIGCITILTLVPGFLWATEHDLPEWLLHEGGIYEHGSAIASLAASLFFFLAFRRSKDRLEGIWLLVLALGTFVLAGEEVSWGQHVFGLEPPDIVRENSFQGELNLHNLTVFQSTNNEVTSWLFRLLIVYLMLLPIVVRIFPTMAELVAATRFPVPTLPIALATLLARAGTRFDYLLVYDGHVFAPDVYRIGETLESLVQVCLLWFAVELWLRLTQKNEIQNRLLR